MLSVPFCSHNMSFLSYKTPNTVLAESVYQFMHGSLYGAAWGAVTPFPAPGTAAAALEAKTGIFRPVPPFHSFRSITSNASFFGSLLFVQRLSSRSLELIRRREDAANDIFGLTMMMPYYHYVLNYSEARLRAHNRFLGVVVLSSLFYANFLA